MGYDYVCLLKDKFVFAQYLTSLGFPTPKNLAVCDAGSLTWFDDMQKLPLEALLGDAVAFDGFCKQLAGLQGKGAFPLRVQNGKLFIEAEGVSLEHVKARLKGRSLIQERPRQHPKLSALHPQSLNTICLVTFNHGGKVEPLVGTLRVRTSGSPVDNWSAGGISLPIDLSEGRVCGEGVLKPGLGTKVRTHPQTGIVLPGFEIPYFHDALELALKLHAYFYGVHSIGWDLAIGCDGPLVIEGNDNWDGLILTMHEKHYTPRFLQFYRSPAP